MRAVPNPLGDRVPAAQHATPDDAAAEASVAMHRGNCATPNGKLEPATGLTGARHFDENSVAKLQQWSRVGTALKYGK